MTQKRIQMTTHTFYKKLTLFIVALTISQTVMAQESVSKTIEKRLPIASDGALYIDNKYGTVTVNGWDNDILQITMMVKVFDKNEDEALNLLERIQPEVTIVGETIYLKSNISEKKQNTFSRFFNKINPIKLNKNNVQIDFTINIPKAISLDVTNKFGDVIIDAFEGHLQTTLQHGDMWINDSIKSATINLKFGELKSKAITNANIELKNAVLDLKSADKLVLKSSGSTIAVDKINELKINSSKDKIALIKVNKIDGDLKFSEIKIEHLVNHLEVALKVTDLAIENIENQNPKITIDQESSDIVINISQTAFKFSAYLTEGVLKIPKTFSNVNSNLIDKGKKRRQINANYGKNTTGIIKLSGYRGTIILKD